eukprot:GHVR01172256.1.p1 GENE.GHVR01172256.1~~GHVR01172256.1.p1  ORF type:complete len:426 (+),score=154.29 GHVR01172256.1:103-1278(+)
MADQIFEGGATTRTTEDPIISHNTFIISYNASSAGEGTSSITPIHSIFIQNKNENNIILSEAKNILKQEYSIDKIISENGKLNKNEVEVSSRTTPIDENTTGNNNYYININNNNNTINNNTTNNNNITTTNTTTTVPLVTTTTYDTHNTTTSQNPTPTIEIPPQIDPATTLIDPATTSTTPLQHHLPTAVSLPPSHSRTRGRVHNSSEILVEGVEEVVRYQCVPYQSSQAHSEKPLPYTTLGIKALPYTTLGIKPLPYNALAVKVTNQSTGQTRVYQSVRRAGESLGINPGTVSRALQSKVGPGGCTNATMGYEFTIAALEEFQNNKIEITSKIPKIPKIQKIQKIQKISKVTSRGRGVESDFTINNRHTHTHTHTHTHIQIIVDKLLHVE